MEEKRYYSVDRLEDGFAVLLSDGDETLTLPLEEVGECGPANKRPLQEGDILVRVNSRWQRDDAEAARRRKKNAALLANLRRRGALK